MIQQVSSTAVVWQCPGCHTSYETAWADLTLGGEDSVGILCVPLCVACGSITGYSLPTQRATMAHLALAEVFSLAKATASYNGAWVEADVTAYLGTRDTISTYLTLPADITGKGGYVHYQAMQKQFNGPQIAAIVKAGNHIWGTDAYVRSIVALVAAGDETVRRQLLANHKLAY